ncbi:MAG: hypothetical protein JST54_03855 [Deltaproteobacteria bacterium]|nr:hypothetical protein [Deltaproteobacteria bacterium]
MRYPKLVAAMFFFAACTDVSSTNIRTGGMTARIRVTAVGNGTTNASATINVGSSLTDFVELQSTDTLKATVGTSSQVMAESKVLGAISYLTSFTGQDAAGTQYTIALQRGASDTSAPSSTCTLPQPFTITAPASSGTNFSRGTQDITVTYTGSGQPEPLAWTATGDCIQAASASISADTGSFIITKGTLRAANSADGGSAESCQVTVSVTRDRAGTLDPAYGGGSTVCSQARTFTITSAP